MDKYSQHLANSLLATLTGLPVGCIVGGLLIGVYGLLTETGDVGQFPNAFGFGLAIALVAFFIGIIPSVLYGAPLYAYLCKRNMANAIAAAIIGVIPGVILLPIKSYLAAFVLLFGVCVSLATHLVAKRRLAKLRSEGANNSFKPKPLRGSA